MTERFLAHLEAEIVQLRAQAMHERARAEAAINQLLAQAGAGAVTRQEFDPALAPLQALIAAEGEDFANAGRT